jgi:hypothetical protein
METRPKRIELDDHDAGSPRRRVIVPSMSASTYDQRLPIVLTLTTEYHYSRLLTNEREQEL